LKLSDLKSIFKMKGWILFEFRIFCLKWRYLYYAEGSYFILVSRSVRLQLGVWGLFFFHIQNFPFFISFQHKLCSVIIPYLFASYSTFISFIPKCSWLKNILDYLTLSGCRRILALTQKSSRFFFACKISFCVLKTNLMKKSIFFSRIVLRQLCDKFWVWNRLQHEVHIVFPQTTVILIQVASESS